MCVFSVSDWRGVLTGPSGTLASPNWPRHYDHNLVCKQHTQQQQKQKQQQQQQQQQYICYA